MSNKKTSTVHEIEKAMTSGGVIYISGVRTYLDNPRNYDVVEPSTGFWIMNAMGWKVFFKTPTREKAQAACDEFFGKGAYRVNSKI